MPPKTGTTKKGMTKKGMTKKGTPKRKIQWQAVTTTEASNETSGTDETSGTHGTQTDIKNKTKGELIEELSKSVIADTKERETCRSADISKALTDVINKYKPAPTEVEKPTNKSLNLVMDVYTNPNENSKGYTTHGYKIRVLNEEPPFSSNDEVSYFIENLFGYIEQMRLPEDQRTREPSNFFKPYKKSLYYVPVPYSHTANASGSQGGRRKKQKSKRAQKNKKRHNKGTQKKKANKK